MTFKSALFALAITLGFGFSAQAHRYEDVKTLTNPLAAEVLAKGNAWAKTIKDGSVVEAFHISELTPSAKNPHESEQEALIRVLKFHLHKNYPITGDDGGYGFARLSGKTEEDLKRKMDDWFYGGGDDESVDAAMSDLLKSFLPINRSQDLIMLQGSGSGNNTAAYILAVVDLKNHEIVYLMVSNFGSDD